MNYNCYYGARWNVKRKEPIGIDRKNTMRRLDNLQEKTRTNKNKEQNKNKSILDKQNKKE